jgi:hypothetical protein
MAGSFKFGDFLVGEHVATGQKPDAFRGFHGEARAAPRYDIDDELGVLPIFKLCRADIEIAAGDASPVTGLGLSKYFPSTGATHFPPMKLS